MSERAKRVRNYKVQMFVRRVALGLLFHRPSASPFAADPHFHPGPFNYTFKARDARLLKQILANKLKIMIVNVKKSRFVLQKSR